MSPPPLTPIRWRNTCRIIPSRYPSVGILDAVAAPGDLDDILELESWTNDRINNELGVIHIIPPEEWVTGRPMASVIMAAFCHPSPGGGRFNGPERGAWYAGRRLDTAHAEVIYHRNRELAEIGVRETRVEMRVYHADFAAPYHDIRPPGPPNDTHHDPNNYKPPQKLGADLLEAGSNGIVYRSVRRPGGECIVCFRPAQVINVRAGEYFEYRWEGTDKPRIRLLDRG